jgi:hypothetical protein
VSGNRGGREYQIASLLELYVDIGKRLFYSLPYRYQPVVDTENPEDDSRKNNNNNDGCR